MHATTTAIDKSVQDTFPNVAIVLIMYLVFMVTNCSAKLKQIENRLRTSMTQGRLVNLAIMSYRRRPCSDFIDMLRLRRVSCRITTELDIPREIDSTAIIFDFRHCEFVWELVAGACVITILIMI